MFFILLSPCIVAKERDPVFHREPALVVCKALPFNFLRLSVCVDAGRRAPFVMNLKRFPSIQRFSVPRYPSNSRCYFR